MEKLAIGIDVGGTNIKVALVDKLGKSYYFQQISTPRGATALIKGINEVVNSFKTKVQGERIAGLGLALPGTVNDATGTLIFSPNLRLSNINFSNELQALNLPLRLVNDANGAALGEAYWGSGQGIDNLICITLGTGLGTGFILNGKLLNKPTGLGGEGGHMVMDPKGPPCTCGRRGCWETFVSATAIVKRMEDKAKAEARGLIGDYRTCQGIFTAYLKGDPLAQEVIEETKEYLALGIANLVNIFSPQAVIISGGVAQSSPILLENLGQMVRQQTFSGLGTNLMIKEGSLGIEAGLIGATVSFFNKG